jgi:hypothetical protein
MKKGLMIALVAVLALAVCVAPAAAKGKKKQPFAGAFHGTTTGGSSISLNVARSGQVSAVNSSIYVVCLSAQSSTPKGGVELFTPPTAPKLGQTAIVEAMQPSAVGARTLTKHYTTTVRRAGKKAVSGELKLSFSYFIPDLYFPRIYLCSGSTQFSASKG